MKWYLNRKVNYFPFDIFLVNRGYTEQQQIIAGIGMKHTFYYFHDGYTLSFRGQEDMEVMRMYLQKKINPRYIAVKSKLLKSLADRFLSITRRAFRTKKGLSANFQLFAKALTEVFGLFQIPDYCQLLLKRKNQKLLIQFGMSRDYAIRKITIAEKIYRTRLGTLLNLPTATAMMLLPDEVARILETGAYPKNASGRKTFCLHTHERQHKILWNKQADQYYKKIIKPVTVKAQQLAGQTAFPGKITGKAYVAFNDTDFKKTPKGAILICSMTRYDIVQYIGKVKALVTDQGGITCHAAIIARELKKPAVIGTKHATDAFKSGDIIEVDANNGTVRKI